MRRTRSLSPFLLGAFVLLLPLSSARAEETADKVPARPRGEMTQAEIEAFLAEPLVARIATVRANHTPQLTPMWFLYENGAVYMSTRAHAAKVKHIRANPNVAVVVDVMEAPYRNKIVTIEGKVEVLAGKDADVKAWTEKIRAKYVRKAAAVLRGRMDEKRVILKITPEKVRSFDSTRPQR